MPLGTVESGWILREPGAAECRLCPASLQKSNLSWQACGTCSQWRGGDGPELPGSPGSPRGWLVRTQGTVPLGKSTSWTHCYH